MNSENQKGIIELLKKASLFSNLNERELQEISKQTFQKQFKKDDLIFSQADHTKELYIVEQGEVLIFKKLDEEKNRVVAEFIAGDCFNELSLFEDSARTANAQAVVDTRLLIFSEEGLKKIMADQPGIAAQILHKLLSAIASRTRSATDLLAQKTRSMEILQKEEITDKLTGHFNHNYFDERFKEEFKDFGEHISVLVFKPDLFKKINDSYGHEIGDQVLSKIAEQVGLVARESDRVVRYRGNEFVIILPQTEKYFALEKAEDLRKQIVNMNLSDITGENTKITASIGVAEFDEKNKRVMDVIENAYEVLFELIDKGGNRVDFV